MSYQIAFVIKAANKLTDIFLPLGRDGRGNNETTQLGWWIPARGEEIPPEDWTMNLMDVNINPTVTQSNIRYAQTIYNEGLYTPVGSFIETPYNRKSANDSEKHETVW